MIEPQSQNPGNGILQTALYNFDQAVRRLKLDEGLRGKIIGPKERIEVGLSPVLPDGRVINVWSSGKDTALDIPHSTEFKDIDIKAVPLSQVGGKL